MGRVEVRCGVMRCGSGGWGEAVGGFGRAQQANLLTELEIHPLPVYSPSVEKIEIVRRGDVRRAKLYYLRGLRGKSARISEKTDGFAGKLIAQEKVDNAEAKANTVSKKAARKVKKGKVAVPEDGAAEVVSDETVVPEIAKKADAPDAEAKSEDAKK